jgi:hypothetical protein
VTDAEVRAALEALDRKIALALEIAESAQDAAVNLQGKPLANANRIQGRRVASTAPNDADVFKWNDTTKKFEPESPSTAVAHTLDSAHHTDVGAITEVNGKVLYWNGSNWAAAAPAGELGGTFPSLTVDATHSGSAHHAKYTDAEAILAVEGESTLALTGSVTGGLKFDETSTPAAPSQNTHAQASTTYYYTPLGIQQSPIQTPWPSTGLNRSSHAKDRDRE